MKRPRRSRFDAGSRDDRVRYAHSSPTLAVRGDSTTLGARFLSLERVGVLHTIVTSVSWVLQARDRTLIGWETSDDFGAPSREAARRGARGCGWPIRHCVLRTRLRG